MARTKLQLFKQWTAKAGQVPGSLQREVGEGFTAEKASRKALAALQTREAALQNGYPLFGKAMAISAADCQAGTQQIRL